MSPSKFWLKLEKSFSSAVVFTKSCVWPSSPEAGITPAGLFMQDAWWQELLTSHLRGTVGCLPWDDVIYAVPPLAPSRSLQMALGALPSCRTTSLLCCFNVCCLCMGASSVAQSGKWNLVCEVGAGEPQQSSLKMSWSWKMLLSGPASKDRKC